MGVASADPLQPPSLNAKSGSADSRQVIWFDCVTDDTYGSKAFYGVVFGWDFHSIGSSTGRYTLIESRGRNVGGLHFRPRVPGTPQGNRWISLMSVDDPRPRRACDRNAPAARSSSRRRRSRAAASMRSSATTKAPYSACSSPKLAIHPTGPRGGRRVSLALDLFTRDPKKAAEFYRGLVGYDVAARDSPTRGSRVVLKTGGVTRAAVIDLPKDIATPGWLPFVQVDDVAAAVGRATANGGKVVFKSRPDYFGGHVAVIADPQGGVIGLVNQAGAMKAGPTK
jgi:predicted enzyme related to lactoylglutathione lyase